MKALLSALAAVWLVIPALAADEPKATDFIRVDEDAQAARLQTAVTRYKKGGVTVDLIGAVHIADAAYYKALGGKFDNYEAVLFEMVGDDKALAKANLEKVKANAAGAGAAKDKKDLSGLHQIYNMAAKFLGLTGQMESIDYTRKNFVHADITLEEFQKLQNEKGESMMSLLSKAEESGVKEPDSAKLVQAMLSGNSNRMKLEIVHTLGSGDDQIATFAGSNSVIIGDRNAKCIKVLDAQVEKGRKRLAIFYGAAHFPDMEKRLLEEGYKKVSHEWLTAWDIPKPQPKAAPAPAEPTPAAEPKKKAA
ncbi:TraB/GumN family protein [Luteolibacter ambystomatis]|uniref:TraB/GumN family protein n=1 Tax=Luteolibacter ambystomatis TaxID=2824561 RepID=A0A975G8N5_9BACT|nr:TraB/GumN family protein [Luteolibacter ambystomatis]QUE50335.1 TraB/GumN family protein [Luteolibacter ambystomatis]